MDKAALAQALASKMGGGGGGGGGGGFKLERKEEEVPVPTLDELHTAATAEDVRSLVAAKGDINMRNEHGATPAFSAACRRGTALAEFIKQGADFQSPRSDNTTPLQGAAFGDCPENVTTLIFAKADVHPNTFEPWQPGQSLKFPVVEALFKAGVPSEITLKGVPVFNGLVTGAAAGGVLIKLALPGGAAQKAGLKDGDIIKAVNGSPTASEQDFNNFLKANCVVSDKVTLSIVSGAEAKEVVMQVGAVGFSWYQLESVYLLRNEEAFLKIQAEETQKKLEQQRKMEQWAPLLDKMEKLGAAHVKKGKVDAKGAFGAIKKKAAKSLAKVDQKAILSNWEGEGEDDDEPETLRDFTMFLCEAFEENQVDMGALLAEL